MTEINLVIQQHYRRHHEHIVTSSSFQDMIPSEPLRNGLLSTGYKKPTRIQCEILPRLLHHTRPDLIVTERCASGKTAGVVVSVLHQVDASCDALQGLIVSCTRELALQTTAMCGQLGKFTQIRIGTLMGGQNMEDNLKMLHTRPHVLVVTPGRVMHWIHEGQLTLDDVNMLVLDDFDRMLSIGCGEEMAWLLKHVPLTTQVCTVGASYSRAALCLMDRYLKNPIVVDGVRIEK